MTSIAYKLLNPDLTTYDGCQWVVGETKRTSGKGNLCGPGWLHGYEHAELAHFLNPIHAVFTNPVLYQVHVGGTCLKDGQLKAGWTEMTLVAPVHGMTPSTEQRVRFAIACALYESVSLPFTQWACNWLDGVDRTMAAAERVARKSKAAAAEWAASRPASAWASTWLGGIDRTQTWAAAEAAWAWAAAEPRMVAEIVAWAAEVLGETARARGVGDHTMLLSTTHFAMSHARRPEPKKGS